MKRFTKHEELWGHFLDVKINSPEVLTKEMSKKPKRGIVLLGSVTDVYQSTEKKYRITRKILEILARHNFPISILTKSNLVLRDIDLFKKFSSCEVGLTITSADEDVVTNFEPHSSSFKQRIESLQKLRKNGIGTYAFIGPILPALTDLEAIFRAIHGKVNFVMAESLNTKCGNRSFIESVISTQYPELLDIYRNGFNKEYWDEIEDIVEKLAYKYKIPLRGFFHHSR